jgi:alkanesulfonate monooxygenase SsuD/methylene tetrahydromethanopterin reductase-like flavin-dependent oxidoreductase (luciferase family)
VILSAAAARTSQIRLRSAVTVLSAADPVRVFQEFATVDLISGGRVELVVGRGSLTLLRPGDTFVQRGTKHSWSNRGDGPATFVSLTMAALR